ncbi:MAG: TlpA family protein disulfide reductase [Spirochaetes bacterium]|nr:MAG: TlpA family protein disulfide reductase [Spirochaetota bacterium]
MRKILFTGFIFLLTLSTPIWSRGRSEEEASAASKKANPTAPSPEIEVNLEKIGFQVFDKPIQAPDFTLKTLDGENRSLSSYHGKLVFLNFWATWCPPCREEMPAMENLHRQLKEEAFAMVGVNLQESLQTVKDFIKQNGYTFEILMDSSGKIGGTYGVRSIPTTYLIDKNGIVLAGIIGGAEWDSPEVYSLLRQIM